MIRYFSMFTGIGGFEIGIQRAFDYRLRRGAEDGSEGQPIHGSLEDSRRRQQQAVCVGYSEIDKYAIETYEHHFKGVKNYGDATTINTSELPDFDLLVGGFPCQAFSVAGKRAGFNDTRGTLIFDVVRILRDKRPRYFVLENVKGLLSHEGGKTFSHILEILTDSGYDVSWSIHNSKNYGVPQNRERIYLIGSLRGERRPQVFPITENDRTTDEGFEKGIQQTANTLRARDYASWRGNHLQQLIGGSQGNRVYATDGISSTIASQAGGLGAKTGLYAVPEAKIRRLTPTECERLQGFPDNWTIGSDTQRYKQCGNAVTVNVVEHVIGELISDD